jgi:pyrimidine deaminase RibD-like protein
MWSNLEEIIDNPSHHHGKLEQTTKDPHRHHKDLKEITVDPCHHHDKIPTCASPGKAENAEMVAVIMTKSPLAPAMQGSRRPRGLPSL